MLEARRWAGYGNWLRIRHSGQWDTGYGHISRYAPGIRPGVHVRQGQVVAYVGATGLATGPHLHYEIWRNGERVNPIGAKVPQGLVLGARSVRVSEPARSLVVLRFLLVSLPWDQRALSEADLACGRGRCRCWCG